MVFRGEHYFLILLKQIVGTSENRLGEAFQRVPTIYVLIRNMKKYQNLSENFPFRVVIVFEIDQNIRKTCLVKYTENFSTQK